MDGRRLFHTFDVLADAVDAASRECRSTMFGAGNDQGRQARSPTWRDEKVGEDMGWGRTRWKSPT
jgi:hypothetical protein